MKAREELIFGEFLSTAKRRMQSRNMSGGRLALLSGAGEHRIGDLMRGERMPRYEYAVRIGEELSSPRLVELAREFWEVPCAFCEKLFLRSRWDAIYCSVRCGNFAFRRRRIPEEADASVNFKGDRAVLWGRRAKAILAEQLADHENAVAAFCKACEPSGLCETPACPLRAVSPLPLATRRSA